MPDWVRGAFCPTCNRMLYRVVLYSTSPQWTQEGAAVEHDAKGRPFVVCKECRNRVPLRQTHDMPGWGYEVDR